MFGIELMKYAVIAVAGKQYRVREGERLQVNRLTHAEGKTFHPRLLLIGGDGDPLLEADELKTEEVTAKVSKHLLGEKVIVGKHRRRTGYKRKKGHRDRLTEIEIKSIGKKRTRTTRKKAEPAKTEESGAAPAKTRARKSPTAQKSTTSRSRSSKTTAKKEEEE